MTTVADLPFLVDEMGAPKALLLVAVTVTSVPAVVAVVDMTGELLLVATPFLDPLKVAIAGVANHTGVMGREPPSVNIPVAVQVNVLPWAMLAGLHMMVSKLTNVAAVTVKVTGLLVIPADLAVIVAVPTAFP